MKITLYPEGYKIHCAQTQYKDVLDVVNVLDTEEIYIIAKETSYKSFKSAVKKALNKHAFRYPLDKMCHVLADGVFTRKRDKTVTLSRRGSSFNSRLSRMLNNYSLAERLGIECHLKNKLLEKERAENQRELLGL